MPGTPDSADYRELVVLARQTALLQSSSALLAWDQEVMMPRQGGEWRSEQLAQLATLAHERATSAAFRDALQRCERELGAALGQDSPAAANVRQWRRDVDRQLRLPVALVAELAATESRAQQAWAQARHDDDFAAFRPWLERMVALQVQKADCLREGAMTRWDALADLHEPGNTAAAMQGLFAPLRQQLAALADRLRGGRDPGESFAKQCFPEPAQEQFVREVLAAMGFDFGAGRLDRSAHPFCTGAGGDVRLTTRFAADNVLDALGSTMHEGGHGLYEQGLPRAAQGTPLGEAVSLGIHESQSRLWENHVGRSAGFWRFAHPIARRHLGAAVDRWTADDLHRQQNRTTPSLIRVEADEATYDLHVMVRCELEQALLHGELAVAELPAAWNARYRDHLGLQVPDDRRGCLQDVHWSCGLFGYFPTYTLGNLYAAQLFAAAERALGDQQQAFARGEFAPLLGWLREHVHAHGRRYEPAELCRRATGAPLSPQPFLTCLTGKLTHVYQL